MNGAPDRIRTCNPGFVDLVADQKWLGFKIKRTEAGLTDTAVGVVEFVARFKVEGKGYRLHETSHFIRVAARWYYTTGELAQ
ncbi:uncharacterized protein METZ01_LOCUS293543 [marine metagenome]|uniref:YchJ-like middle NTF2-like domain-containing protein n=1 Tax=marine metagenome TaxID=408172 RepID=A0A382LVB1_9ZZZZ